jgi:hypothetical protein
MAVSSGGLKWLLRPVCPWWRLVDSFDYLAATLLYTLQGSQHNILEAVQATSYRTRHTRMPVNQTYIEARRHRPSARMQQACVPAPLLGSP